MDNVSESIEGMIKKKKKSVVEMWEMEENWSESERLSHERDQNYYLLTRMKELWENWKLDEEKSWYSNESVVRMKCVEKEKGCEEVITNQYLEGRDEEKRKRRKCF